MRALLHSDKFEMEILSDTSKEETHLRKINYAKRGIYFQILVTRENVYIFHVVLYGI